MERNADDFLDEEPAASADDFLDEAPVEEPSTLRRYVADPLISLVGKGAVGVGEAVSGLNEMARNGILVRGAEALAREVGLVPPTSQDVGYRPKAAKAALESWMSPEQQAANKALDDAKGVEGALSAMGEYPSVVPHKVLESVPSIFAGGAVARGVSAAPALARAAVGEGLVSAGSTAEAIRQDTPGERLSAGQSVVALGSGALTALLGAGGGKIAQKLGIGDIDTWLAGAPSAAARKSMARRVIEGAIAEGVLEEMPQSMQEQIAQNVATGRPWDEGVAKAGTVGAVIGGVVGGGMNVRSPAAPTPAPPVDPAAMLEPENVDLPSEADMAAERRAQGMDFAPPDVAAMQADTFTASPGAQPAPNEIAPVGNEIDIEPFLRERALLKGQALDAAGWLGQGDLLGRPFENETLEIVGALDRLAETNPAAVRAIVREIEDFKPEKGEARGQAQPAKPAEAPAPAPDAQAARDGQEAGPAPGTADEVQGDAAQVAPQPRESEATLSPAPRESEAAVSQQPESEQPAARDPRAGATIDESAARADPDPSTPKIEANNAKLGHDEVGGVPIAIETAAGAVRYDRKNPTPKWRRTMTVHYGRVKGTKGADGDEMDVMVVPGTPRDWSGPVFVVDQLKANGRGFDETKTVIGAADEAAARKAYASNYPRGWKVGPVTQMSMEQFRAWTKSPLTARAARSLSRSEMEGLTAKQRSPEQVERLRQVEGEIGWAEEGGRLLRAVDTGGEKAEVTGRTSWIAKSEFWPGRPEKISQAEARDALAKLSRGERIAPRQQRFVDYAEKWIGEQEVKEQKARENKRREPDLRARVDALDTSGMSREDLEREIVKLRAEMNTSAVTGIPNARALKAAASKPLRANVDADALKWINDSLGHQAGDQMLAAIGQAFQKAGVEAYHVSGDEFVAQFESEEQAYEAMGEVKNILSTVEITATLPDGSTITKKGVDFSYGLGQDNDTAEAALRRDKADREDSGARPARGAEPQGVVRRPARQAGEGRDQAAEVTPETPADAGVSTSAPKETFEERTTRMRERRATLVRDLTERLERDGIVVGVRPNGYKLALTRSTSGASPFRVTSFLPDDTPIGHRDYNSIGQGSPIDTAAHEFMGEVALQDAPVAKQPEPASSNALELKGETESEIRTREAREKREADEKKKRDSAPDVGGFTLTGSDRPADVARAAGQMEIAAADRPALNTEDSGAELTANKRNRIRTGIKWDDISGKNETLRVAETTKQNVYPRPDYQALIDGGMQPFAAHLVKQVYDAIAVKPQTARPTDEDLKTYIAGVNRVMTGALAWVNNREALVAFVQEQARYAGAMAGRQISVSALAGERKTMLSSIYPDGWKANRTELRTIGGNKVLGAIQPGMDEMQRAMKAIEQGWPASQEAWQKRGFKVVEVGGKWQVQNKHGRMLEEAATEEDAKERARERTKRETKDQISEKGISVEAAEREGPARRMEGEDVSSDQVRDAFGFKGVNFGNWMKGDTPGKRAERQLHLNHAYDAFMDLAEILGVPPKAMSLNGMLGLAIGAQGTGQYAAHFVPGVNEINLTRTSGAGSLAHEWGHALDHYFATQAGLATRADPFLTEYATGDMTEGRTVVENGRQKYVREPIAGSTIRPEIVAQFKAIVEAMNKRPETEVEMQARNEGRTARAQKNVDGWLASIKRDFTRDGKVEASAFDAIADKIKALDLGDGAVQAGNTILSPRVDELRALYKAAHGRTYSLDNVKGLQANIDHLVYLASQKDAQVSHEPQMVSTQYAASAAALDRDKGGKRYWSTNLEKFARAFDAFVSDTLEERAAKNTYLSHAGRMDETVPQGEERKAINKAFADLIAQIETREEGDRTVLFARLKQQASRKTGLPVFTNAEVSLANAREHEQQIAGVKRIAFDILDSAAFKAALKEYGVERAMARAKVGEVLMLMRGDSFDALENIQIFPTARGKGWGEKTVRSMLDSQDTPIRILDIQPDAVDFWVKMGAQFPRSADYMEARLDRFQYATYQRQHGRDQAVRGDDASREAGVRREAARDDAAGASDESGGGGADRRGTGFSRVTEAPERGLSVSRVRAVIEPVVAGWANAPDVVVIETLEDAPKAVRQQDASQLAQGAEGRPYAFFHGGKVYIIASEVVDEEQAIVGLYHEALGHYGLRGVFGDRLDEVLTQLVMVRRAEVAEKAKEYGLDMLKREDRLVAAEEVLAIMAQTRPEIGFVRRAVATIRSFLRSLGLKLSVSDDEIIRNLILPARAWVERGRPGKAEAKGPVFHRAYHGTPHDFDRFSTEKIGTGEGAQAYGYGLYFAGSREVAEFYKKKLTDDKRSSDPETRRLWTDLAALLALEDLLGFDTVGEAVGAVRQHADWKERWDVGERAERIQEAFDAYEARRKSFNGRLFEVELTPKEDEYLDWDKPIAQQSAKVRAALESADWPGSVIPAWMKNGAWEHVRGDALYRNLSQALAKPIPSAREEGWTMVTNTINDRAANDRAASRFLASIGIPGIRYLDGSSRGKGEGHHNYVLFSDEHVSVVAKFARQGANTPPPVQGPAQGPGPWRPGSWQSPSSGKLDNLIYTLQDKHIDTKRVVEAITSAQRQIADREDAYLQEELFHGRAAKGVTDFLEQELKPMLKEMANRGVKMEAFEEWLHARHAREANAVLAQRNPGGPPGLSGMTDQEAARVLTAARAAGFERAYQAVATRLDAIIEKTRQELVSYGLASAHEVAAWKAAYQHYVPLQREDMDSGPGIGQGFSVRGPASKQRTGSTRAVTNILANVALARERAIVRGEKNRVANALVGLALANPNPDFWRVDTPPTVKSVDPRTGLVTSHVDPLYKNRENVMVARTPTPTGDVIEHAVVFNEHDERASRMAASLKNLDIDQLGVFLGTVAKATRFLAALSTQYNPVFGVVNLTRDVQGAMLNLTSTPLAGKQAEVMSHTLSALRGIYIDLREHRAGRQPTSAWAQHFEEFQKAGGKTGYRDLFRTADDRADALKRELERAAGTGNVVKRLSVATMQPVADWLSDYNEAMENAVRLAAYKVGVDSGMSRERAASVAKNLTVNFNRRGAATMQVGALYAFFNASVQGSARMIETLAGPKGKQIIAGGVLLGALQAAALSLAGFDEDEPPEFVRERNLVIPIGGKRYVTIPMPLGFHILPNLGRVATEYVLSGFRKPGKRAGDILATLFDGFSPVGGVQGLSWGSVASLASPTVMDPVVALATNRDWTGKPIAREDFNKLRPTPGHARAKDTATELSKAVSQAINALSGGTAYKPGAFSPTPDQIDYLIGQLTGGVGREVSKATQTAVAPFTGEDLPPYKVPLLGRFYGNAEASSAQASRFYDNLRDLSEHRSEITGRRRAGEPIGEYIRANPEARLVERARDVERRVAALRREKSKALKRGDRARVKSLEDRMNAVMTRFNEDVKRARQ